MENHLAALLHRTAVLMNEDDDERSNTLGELFDALDDPQTNKTRSRAVLDNEEVMDVILNLSATTNFASVAVNAFRVLSQMARDLDNARRLFREHPSLILVAMRRLEFGVESSNEQLQRKVLIMLSRLARNIDSARSMTTKNPALVPLLLAKVASNSKQVQVGALGALQNLALNDDNARDMATKYPTLVPLLMAKVESNSEEVQTSALDVLHNLTIHVDNKREMLIKSPTLVSLLVAKVDSDSEQAQVGALDVLRNLATNVENKREIVTENPTLVSLLVTKVDSNSEQVQARALTVLSTLAYNDDNARDMVTKNPLLVSLLVAKMSGSTALQAAMVFHHLSCSPASRAILRGNDSVVAALTKGRESKNEDTSLLSILALVNLFGAEEDSEVRKMDLAMLQQIFNLIARAMNKDEWSLDAPLLAFRYLCMVKDNRQLLWDEYGSEFLTSVLAALQRAIGDKDIFAAESAVSTLAQFSNDPEPLVWMRSNKPLLVFDQLAPFPEAFKTAQALLLTLDPAKVSAKRVLSDAAPAKRQQVAFSKSCIPQNEQEIREWLSKHEHGQEIADKLVKESLVGMEMLSKKSAAELETLLKLNAVQALTLEDALRELF